MRGAFPFRCKSRNLFGIWTESYSLLFVNPKSLGVNNLDVREKHVCVRLGSVKELYLTIHRKVLCVSSLTHHHVETMVEFKVQLAESVVQAFGYQKVESYLEDFVQKCYSKRPHKRYWRS